MSCRDTNVLLFGIVIALLCGQVHAQEREPITIDGVSVFTREVEVDGLPPRIEWPDGAVIVHGEDLYAGEFDDPPPEIVKAKLEWREMGGPQSDNVTSVPIDDPERLAILAQALARIRQWNDRSFGLPEGHYIWGRLHIVTADSRFRILITPHGYFFEADFPGFMSHFYSIGLTDAIERVLRNGLQDERDTWEGFQAAYWGQLKPSLDGTRYLADERKAWERLRSSTETDTESSGPSSGEQIPNIDGEKD